MGERGKGGGGGERGGIRRRNRRRRRGRIVTGVDIFFGSTRVSIFDEAFQRRLASVCGVDEAFLTPDEAEALRRRNAENVFFHVETRDAAHFVDVIEITVGVGAI